MENKVIQRVGRLVSVRIFDRMMDRQTRNLSKMFGKTIAQAGGKVRLLLSIETHFPGKGPEALLESLNFTKIHSEHIERVAIIGTNESERTVIGLFGLFGGVQMQFFKKPDVVKAIMWLQGTS